MYLCLGTQLHLTNAKAMYSYWFEYLTSLHIYRYVHMHIYILKCFTSNLYVYLAHHQYICCICNFLCFTDKALLGYKSSTSDGNILATAAAQLKIFHCSNYKKIQKFSGHPVSIIQCSSSDCTYLDCLDCSICFALCL